MSIPTNVSYSNGPSAEQGASPTKGPPQWSGNHSNGNHSNGNHSSKELPKEAESGTGMGQQMNSTIEPEPRWPFNKLMNSSFGRSPWKNHVIAMIGEAVGTGSFLFFAFAGAEVGLYGKTTGQTTVFDPTTVLYIAIAFGMSLMVNVFIFFRVSGALFNPAVTFAMLLTRSITPMRCLVLFVAQILAALFASYIVSVITPTTFGVVTKPSNGCTVAQAVCIEMILTAYLIMSIFMLAGEKHKGRFMAPVSIGMSLFSAHLVGVQWTGAGMNPARSFGPAVVTGDWTKHWIYWVGPAAGATIAAGLYKMFKHMRYQEANPGSDVDYEVPREASTSTRH